MNQSQDSVQFVDKIIEINEHRIKLKFIRLYQTFMLWIGDPMEPKFNSLVMSLCNNSTTIFDNKFNHSINDEEMAKKLSNRFNNNRPVYVSFNYQPAMFDGELKLKIDQSIIEFLNSIFK